MKFHRLLDTSEWRKVLCDHDFRVLGAGIERMLTLARQSTKLYWWDGGGFKVMHCNLDVGVLVLTGSGTGDRKDMCRGCVIITVDEL